MKKLVNYITFVWKCSFVNDIDNIFFLLNSFQHHQKIMLHFIGELYWRHSFLLWEIVALLTYLLENVLPLDYEELSDSSSDNLDVFTGTLVYLSALGNFLIRVKNSFFWYNWWFEARYIFIYIRNFYNIYESLWVWS